MNSSVINQQMNHLGRTKGNPLLAICQKYLTGQSEKELQALECLTACQQVLQNGHCSRKSNADNVDHILSEFEHLGLPVKNISTVCINAFMLTSSVRTKKWHSPVGSWLQNICSRLLYAERYEDYRVRTTQRQPTKQLGILYRACWEDPFFKAKDHSAWAAADESAVFLNPEARVSGKSSRQNNGFRFLPTTIDQAQRPNQRIRVLSQGAHGDWKDDLEN